VDGTDFRIQGRKTPRGKYNKAWYSQKFKGPGIRYEVAVCILTGHIVWINGPFLPGDWPDIEIFRAGLLHMLEHGERVEADKGYRGEAPQHCITPDCPIEPNRVGLHRRVALRHETVNKRFKNWGCMAQRFRHSVQKHSACFRMSAILTQLAIESGEELFDVREYNDLVDDEYIRDVLGH
jgi:hypothetical protein